MGKSIICNYEVQAEKGSGSFTLQGARSFREAFNVLIEELLRIKGKTGYIWPQTRIARAYFAKNYAGSDLVKVIVSGEIIGKEVKRE